jgi:hypothetical protein
MNLPPESLTIIFEKAAADADFRARCLADPAAAVREATGADAPAGITFSETPAGSAIVLPPLRADADEIADIEMLSDVAGGNLGHQYGSITHPVYGGTGCTQP